MGKLTTYDDNDIHAVCSNLRKARRIWARLSQVCRSENVPPKVAAMFYRAVIQSVLLFGCETWVLSDTIKRLLRGFHIKAAYQMAKLYKPRKDENGVWTYPASKDALEEVGLLTIDEYIERRRETIVEYVATRPVLDLCRNERRRPGTTHHKRFWWDQVCFFGL